MASNRQRNKLSRRLFSRLMSLRTNQMSIESDPLANKYDVNKFGLVVEHDDFQALVKIHREFMNLLIQDGWKVDPFVEGEVQVSKPAEYEAMAFVSKPWKMVNRPGNQGTFHISIGG